MSPVFTDVGANAANILVEAGRRHRLMRLTDGPGEEAQSVRARLFEPILDGGQPWLRAAILEEDEDEAWVRPGVVVQGFFALYGETYAFEAAVERREGRGLRLSWPRRTVQVLRRRHRRVSVRPDEAVHVKMWPDGASGEAGSAPITGLLRDLSVGGVGVTVPVEERGPLQEGAVYLLAFRAPGATAAELRLPALLCHVLDQAGGKRVKCGFRFITEGLEEALADRAGTEGAVRVEEAARALDAVADYVARRADRKDFV